MVGCVSKQSSIAVSRVVCLVHRYVNPLLLYRMIQIVPPDDLEAFTSTCRTIHSLAQRILRRHRSLKSYRSINLDGYETLDSSQGSMLYDKHDALLLLECIIDNPDVRYYVQNL